MAARTAWPAPAVTRLAAGAIAFPESGPGFAGGGGGNSGSSGSLSISGEPGATGQDALDATIFREMVYPVPSTVVLRKNALVVSAGPMGGGGLSVYGALRCGKIYTVFLPMPGRPWTLQFCQSGAAAKPAEQNSLGGRAHGARDCSAGRHDAI